MAAASPTAMKGCCSSAFPAPARARWRDCGAASPARRFSATTASSCEPRGGRVLMHGTPWHGDAALVAKGPVPLSRVFFLHQGPECAMPRSRRRWRPWPACSRVASLHSTRRTRLPGPSRRSSRSSSSCRARISGSLPMTPPLISFVDSADRRSPASADARRWPDRTPCWPRSSEATRSSGRSRGTAAERQFLDAAREHGVVPLVAWQQRRLGSLNNWPADAARGHRDARATARDRRAASPCRADGGRRRAERPGGCARSCSRAQLSPIRTIRIRACGRARTSISSSPSHRETTPSKRCGPAGTRRSRW